MATDQHTGPPALATEALRKAIASSGLAFREIARRSGVDVGVISRFMGGTRTPTLETADRIIDALGLELQLKPKPAEKR